MGNEGSSDSRAEFEGALRRAGLSVSASQVEKLLPGYVELRAVVELLRGRPHTAEPSNIFALRPFLQPGGGAK